MGGVVSRTDDFPPCVKCLYYYASVSSLCRCIRRYAVLYVPPLRRKGEGGGVVRNCSNGRCIANNRRGIDVTSVNEGANIGRPIVRIITAGNWPIIVYTYKVLFFGTPNLPEFYKYI